MTAIPRWAGKRVTAAHEMVATWLPAPCGQCGEPVTGEPFVTGHRVPRWERPDLTWVPSNWQPEHKACSDRSAQGEVIAKAKAQVLDMIAAGHDPEVLRRALREPVGKLGSPYGANGHKARGHQGSEASTPHTHDFPHGETRREPPLLPISLPNTSATAATTRSDLAWSPGDLVEYHWLRPFLEVPPDASPPLWMSKPPASAVGSYGEEAIAKIEKSQKITLRWWQKLAITRQLEHDDQGRLVHREVLESTPRRAGKSVRMKVTALWRLAQGPKLFGETQLVMHTGSDMAICREVQQQAWRWAEENAGWKVTRANGKESIATRTGDRWLVRAQNAVYGYDICLAIADECWDVDPTCVSEGLEPATLERSSPQVHLTSTAHRRATSLMRGKLSAALAADDGQTLLMVWAAPPGSDPADPETWKAASPYWSEDRHRMIAAKYAAALVGESDPELDDPDPMAGFTSQYLNVWRLSERRQQKGEPLTDRPAWSALAVQVPHGVPMAAAIESWDGISLALSWLSEGRALVSVTAHPDLASAAAALRASGYRGLTTVGASLAKDPALRGIRVQPGEARTGATVADLRRMLREDAIRHDGGEHLARQVLAVRTTPGADGPRMASQERADAVKAMVWAARAARAKPRPQKLRMTLPTNV